MATKGHADASRSPQHEREVEQALGKVAVPVVVAAERLVALERLVELGVRLERCLDIPPSAARCARQRAPPAAT